VTSAAAPHEHAPAQVGAFRHELLLYAGEDDFVAATSSFLREGVEAGEPALVVVSARKIQLLREALDGDSASVLFADMAEVGANPARIIPAWRDFVSEYEPAGRALRGIGEPISAERGPAELTECQRHESLLNVAFDGAPRFRLVCPYDVDALDADVIAEARRSHPFVLHGGASLDYRGGDACAAPFDAELPEPPAPPAEIAFAAGDDLSIVRAFVARRAEDAGLAAERAMDLVLAVDEVAANSVRYGGGLGTLRVWRDADALFCEVRDRGRIAAPLVGRQRPSLESEGGWGLWIVNQLCDLVQLRTFADGSVVRLHMRLS